jgi:F0F1-type ATP synthase assembly protein I
MLLGAGLDWWLETSPWLMLLGLVFGFTAMIRILLRMRKLVEAASEEHVDDESP